MLRGSSGLAAHNSLQRYLLPFENTIIPPPIFFTKLPTIRFLGVTFSGFSMEGRDYNFGISAIVSFKAAMRFSSLG